MNTNIASTAPSRGDENTLALVAAFHHLSPAVQALVQEFVEVAAAMYLASGASGSDDEAIRLRTIRLRAGLLHLDVAFWNDREDPR